MNIEVVVVKNKQGQTIDDMYQKSHYIFKFTAENLLRPYWDWNLGKRFERCKNINLSSHLNLMKQ